MASSTRNAFASAQRDYFLNVPLAKKRETYSCGQAYHQLSDLPIWPLYAKVKHLAAPKSLETEFAVNKDVNNRISIFTGSITALECDVIVNAANRQLHGGGGVDGAIHRAAGPELVKESKSLAPCETGQTKLTAGYRLPAKYVIHTVGPVGEKMPLLASCYTQSLNCAKVHSLTSIAFPCISTGVYGYPNEAAAHVALRAVRLFLQDPHNANSIERVIFCLFMPVDIDIYSRLLHVYFPLGTTH